MPEQQPEDTPKGWKKYFDIEPYVFWPSAILIIFFIAVTLLVGKPMEEIFTTVQTAISSNSGWFLILVVNFFLVLCFFLAFSKYGKIRLGGQKAQPEFSTFSWFAMLFSAGMGIGIMFYGVAEPVLHFNSPPEGTVEPQSIASAKLAMNKSFLHWGLHAWGIYALVGMALAFFCYNRKLPLSVRSVFYPLIGDKIHGPVGHLIDTLAVLATLFGLATSLGFGVQQVNAGMEHLFGFEKNVTNQVILIALITGAATASVVTGLDKGVKFLSKMNLRLAAIFLLFVLIVGPTVFILDSFVQNTGNYVQTIFRLSTWAEAYTGSDWQNSWTVFYWSWWISWSPFVGIFIARVSYGRTIKEFMLGVLLVPSLLTFLWLSTFGGSAIFGELNGEFAIIGAVQEDVATALFKLLENFPLPMISAFIGMLLVINFFVTSSDSGSLVIDSITSGGKQDAPVGQRVFWATTEGAVAAVLLVGGGLGALQTAAITTGLPFAVVLVMMTAGLLLGLRQEYNQKIKLPSRQLPHHAYPKAEEKQEKSVPAPEDN